MAGFLEALFGMKKSAPQPTPVEKEKAQPIQASVNEPHAADHTGNGSPAQETSQTQMSNPDRETQASGEKLLSFEETQESIYAELNELEEMLKLRKSNSAPVSPMTVVDRGAVSSSAIAAADEAPPEDTSIQADIVSDGSDEAIAGSEETPAAEGKPEISEPVEAEEAPVIEEATAAEEAPVIEEATAVEEVHADEEISAEEEAPAEEEVPAAEENVPEADQPAAEAAQPTEASAPAEASSQPEVSDPAEATVQAEEPAAQDTPSIDYHPLYAEGDADEVTSEHAVQDYIHEEFGKAEIAEEEYASKISDETTHVEPAVIDPVEYTKANSPFMYYETVDADEVLPEEKPAVSLNQQEQDEEASEEANSRNSSVFDDILLIQIDELRRKAVELKKVLNDKESKAEELEMVVAERSEKAAELKEILEERQAEADGVASVVELQLDKLIDRVEHHMVTIERTMADDMNQVTDKVITGVNARLDESLGTMQNQMGALQNHVGSLKNDVDAFRIHMDRRMDQMQQNSTDISAITAANESQTDQIRRIMTDDNDAMLQQLEALKQELNQMKADVNDRIHKENVCCARSVKELIRETDEERKKVDEEVDEKLAAIKKQNVGITVCTVINIVIVIAVALRFMGIF